MPKRPLFSKSGSGVPRREEERLQASIGTRLEFWIVSLVLGLFAIVVAVRTGAIRARVLPGLQRGRGV